MKQLLLICAVVGCGGKSGPAKIADPILEKAIRKSLKKPKVELTKAQIAELQKALPNCKIEHNAKK